MKPAKPKNDSDPTGAGDAYRAGLVAGLARMTKTTPISQLSGNQLAVCGQMGSVAAVYTVEKYGTQTHTFTKKEFMKRYKRDFGSILTL